MFRSVVKIVNAVRVVKDKCFVNSDASKAFAIVFNSFANKGNVFNSFNFLNSFNSSKLNFLNSFNSSKLNTPKNLLLLLLAVLMASCSSDEGDGPTTPKVLPTVQLYISVPTEQGTRAGDPGTATGEGVDWDMLTLLLEYTTDGNPGTSNPTYPRLVKQITKSDFEKLPSLDAEGKIRLLTLEVEEGNIYIYGVTYSRKAAGDCKTLGTLEGDIFNWRDNITDIDIPDLKISNDYAADCDNALAKFLSVATGFYDSDNDGQKDYLEVRLSQDNGVGQPIPRITLTRLATLVDIQWDAQDAYDNSYTNVKVTGFTYNGGATNDGATVEGKGSGRLFPELYTGTTPLGVTTQFYNTTPISQRNGRVYHYVYPDGTTAPNVTFNISADPGSRVGNYTFTMPKLQRATWYKVNTTIKGLTGTATIDISAYANMPNSQ